MKHSQVVKIVTYIVINVTINLYYSA